MEDIHAAEKRQAPLAGCSATLVKTLSQSGSTPAVRR